MRSTSSNANLQQILRTQYNYNTDADQYTGTYYAKVVQTDVSVAHLSPPPIPTGQMTIVISAISSNSVWGPLPYPGSTAPPLGTTATVTFDQNNNPIVHSFVNWSHNGATGTVTLKAISSGGSNGSLTFKNGIITAFINPT